MKTDKIEEKLRASTQRKEERLALWEKISTAKSVGGLSDVEGLLDVMATALEQRKSQLSTKLAKETGVQDVEIQES